MNIYKISQSANKGWDTYDSAVVVAANEDDAKKIHPSGKDFYDDWWTREPNPGFGSTWANKLADVQVELVGVAREGLEPATVVCASFNAG